MASTTKLDPTTLEAAAVAGELLIRAAATLGRLSPEQQALLAKQSALPELLASSLTAAQALSPEVGESMRTHGPRGFVSPA